MLLPDVNVLVAGFRPDHPHHGAARTVLAEARARSARIALTDLALGSLVRLLTNPKVFAEPDSASDALDYVDALLAPPGLLLVSSPAVWRRFTRLCREHDLRGNAVPDAHLAAFALEHRAELVTFDRGFARYEGLRWTRPPR